MNVYLIDGMYNNDDRLGGSQGTQVRVVLDNIEEYQVLSNQYSAEFGGGAGAICLLYATREESSTPIVRPLAYAILAHRDGVPLSEGRSPCLNWS